MARELVTLVRMVKPDSVEFGGEPVRVQTVEGLIEWFSPEPSVEPGVFAGSWRLTRRQPLSSARPDATPTLNDVLDYMRELAAMAARDLPAGALAGRVRELAGACGIVE